MGGFDDEDVGSQAVEKKSRKGCTGDKLPLRTEGVNGSEKVCLGSHIWI